MKGNKPWLHEASDLWEVNPDIEGLRVNTGCGVNIEIDKLYGPLAAHKVRIRCETNTAEWVVEYQHIDTEEWIEVARWDCQLTFSDDNDN